MALAQYQSITQCPWDYNWRNSSSFPETVEIFPTYISRPYWIQFNINFYSPKCPQTLKQCYSTEMNEIDIQIKKNRDNKVPCSESGQNHQVGNIVWHQTSFHNSVSCSAACMQLWTQSPVHIIYKNQQQRLVVIPAWSASLASFCCCINGYSCARIPVHVRTCIPST